MLIPIALLLPTVLGYFVITLVLKKGEKSATGLLERCSMAYPLGMGMLSLQMFLLGLLRVPLTLFAVTSVIAIEIAILAFWARRMGAVLFPRPSFGLLNELRDRGVSPLRKAALVLLACWIAAKLGSVLYEASLRPIFAWDVWANWAVGAKSFYYSRSLLLDVPAGLFFGANTVSRIISYPLHNPLMQVWLGLWAGGFDEVLVKFWSPVTLLSMAGGLYAFARREIGGLAALGIVAVFLGAPLLSYHSIEAYSDLLLGASLFFALLSFVSVMRGRTAYLPLIGAFSAVALFTKNEAPGFVFPLMLSAGAWLWFNRKQEPFAKSLVSLLGPLTAVLPWFLFKFAYSLSLTQDSHTLSPVFHPGVFDYIAGQLATLQNFNILLVALPVLLAVNGRPTKELLHAVFPVAFFALFFIVLYMLIEYYYSTLLMGTVFYRNVLTWYPSLTLVTVLVLRELTMKTESPAPSQAAKPAARRRK